MVGPVVLTSNCTCRASTSPKTDAPNDAPVRVGSSVQNQCKHHGGTRIEERPEPPLVGFIWVLLNRYNEIISGDEGRFPIGTPNPMAG